MQAEDGRALTCTLSVSRAWCCHVASGPGITGTAIKLNHKESQLTWWHCRRSNLVGLQKVGDRVELLLRVSRNQSKQANLQLIDSRLLAVHPMALTRHNLLQRRLVRITLLLTVCKSVSTGADGSGVNKLLARAACCCWASSWSARSCCTTYQHP